MSGSCVLAGGLDGSSKGMVCQLNSGRAGELENQRNISAGGLTASPEGLGGGLESKPLNFGEDGK